MPKPFPDLTLVLGGARSGKSLWAETLVQAAARPKVYIATAQAFDDEMTERIAQHKQQRGEGWVTIEAPSDIAGALDGVAAGSVVLIDCLTLWLGNRMLAEADIAVEVAELLDVLTAAPVPVVCVSNEVGMGLVPDNALGRKFRDAQGALNRDLAARADLAVFVAAGLPLVLKGRLPEGMA